MGELFDKRKQFAEELETFLDVLKFRAPRNVMTEILNLKVKVHAFSDNAKHPDDEDMAAEWEALVQDLRSFYNHFLTPMSAPSSPRVGPSSPLVGLMALTNMFQMENAPLESASAASLPKDLEDFIVKTHFPQILIDPLKIDVVPLNENPLSFFDDPDRQTVQCPSVDKSMTDLLRNQAHFTVTVRGETVPLNAWLKIKQLYRADRTSCYYQVSVQGKNIYDGADVVNKEEDARNALSAIQEIVAQQVGNENAAKIVPFLCQNGVVEQRVVEYLSLLKLSLTVDSGVQTDVQAPPTTTTLDSGVQTDVQAPPTTTTLKDAVEQAIRLGDMGLNLLSPKSAFDIDFDQGNEVVITETYWFDHCLHMPDASSSSLSHLSQGAATESELLYPVQITQVSRCIVSHDSPTAQVHLESVKFDHAADMPYPPDAPGEDPAHKTKIEMK